MDATQRVVPPEKVTSGPARLRLFVNGRAVRDRLISHGVTEGVRSFLMKGTHHWQPVPADRHSLIKLAARGCSRLQ